MWLTRLYVLILSIILIAGIILMRSNTEGFQVVPCLPGTFSVNGIPPCTPCEPGTFTITERQTVCRPCGTNGQQLYSARGASECMSSCPVGTYANARTGGGFGCLPCPAGTWNYTTNTASSCTPCPAGTTGDIQGISGPCQPCLAGFASSAVGAAWGACKACAAGSSSPRGGSQCIPCEPGKFREYNAGGGICLTCGSGQFSGSGAATCSTCGSGQFSGPGAGVCSTCGSGQFSTAGASSCSTCGSGQFSIAGDRVCSTCGSGQFSSPGAKTCSFCPEGRYSSPGATDCAICPENTYSKAGAGACIPCPANTFSSAGSGVCRPFKNAPSNPAEIKGNFLNLVQTKDPVITSNISKVSDPDPNDPNDPFPISFSKNIAMYAMAKTYPDLSAARVSLFNNYDTLQTELSMNIYDQAISQAWSLDPKRESCNQLKNIYNAYQGKYNSIKSSMKDLSLTSMSAVSMHDENIAFQNTNKDQCGSQLSQACIDLASQDIPVFSLLAQYSVANNTLFSNEAIILDNIDTINKVYTMLGCTNPNNLQFSTTDIGDIDTTLLSLKLQDISPYYLSPDALTYITSSLISSSDSTAVSLASASTRLANLSTTIKNIKQATGAP